jgi:type IX secretion system PorP/SprF family membrane protein
MAFSVGAGIFYRTEEIYFGASVLNINESQLNYTPSETTFSEANYNLRRHYYVTAGYNMQLPNPAWEIKPAVLLNSDARSTYLDLNLTCAYNKKIWAGVSYRSGTAIVGMLGLEIYEGLKVGFSYDVQTTAVVNQSQGSYEILLNYSFKIDTEKEPQKYKSIRFL